MEVPVYVLMRNETRSMLDFKAEIFPEFWTVGAHCFNVNRKVFSYIFSESFPMREGKTPAAPVRRVVYIKKSLLSSIVSKFPGPSLSLYTFLPLYIVSDCGLLTPPERCLC